MTTHIIVCETIILLNGCDSTTCFELNFSPNVTTYFIESICPGESYFWNGLELYNDTTITDTLTALIGCDSIVNFSLETFPVEPIILSTSGSLCDNGEVEITSNNFSNYLWSTGETTPSIAVNSVGNYSITATDLNGCIYSNEIEIQTEVLEISFQTVSPSCFGDNDGSVQIDFVDGGTGPYMYSLNGEPFQPTPIFEDLESDSYVLSVEDINGCTNETEVIIDSPDELILETQNFYEIQLGESLELELITNISQPEISWQPPYYLNCDTCLVVNARPENSIMYEILVKDSNNCEIKDLISIEVDKTLDVFIPNAFSPNDDGFNDVFTVYAGQSVEKINSMKIFSRWGELVYEEKEFAPNTNSNGWNGMLRNKRMQSGVYVYVVEVQRIDGSTHTLTGELSLVR